MKNENDRKLTIIPEIDMFLLSLYIHYTIYIYIFIYLFIYYNLIKKHWFKSFNIIVIMPRTDPDIRISDIFLYILLSADIRIRKNN